MLVLERKLSWLRLVLRYHGGVVSHIWRRIALTTAIGVVVTVVHVGELFQDQPLPKMLTVLPFSLVGLALSIILGFRNTTCYNRFWEGRILWGRLINTSRSFCRQLMTMLEAPAGHEEEVEGWKREMVRRTCAFAHGLRFHLRDQRAELPSLARLLPPGEVEAAARSSNPPATLLHVMGERLAFAWRRGWLHPMLLPTLERSVTELTDIQGGCERIKNTPVPFAYTLLIHRIAGLYCIALPFGIIHEVGLYTPLVVLFVSYAFFGLDAIGDEIEDPFGLDDHDLPLSQLATLIEINLREKIGDRDLPAPVRPVDGVLS